MRRKRVRTRVIQYLHNTVIPLNSEHDWWRWFRKCPLFRGDSVIELRCLHFLPAIGVCPLRGRLSVLFYSCNEHRVCARGVCLWFVFTWFSPGFSNISLGVASQVSSDRLIKWLESFMYLIKIIAKIIAEQRTNTVSS